VLYPLSGSWSSGARNSLTSDVTTCVGGLVVTTVDWAEDSQGNILRIGLFLKFVTYPLRDCCFADARRPIYEYVIWGMADDDILKCIYIEFNLIVPMKDRLRRERVLLRGCFCSKIESSSSKGFSSMSTIVWTSLADTIKTTHHPASVSTVCIGNTHTPPCKCSTFEQVYRLILQ